MRIEPIGPGWVARVSGVDLRDALSEPDWEHLGEAWSAHPCLVFPEQHGLSAERQVALLSRFGPVLEERIPGQKHSFVTNERGHGVDEMNEGYLWGELTPHMDFTYTRFPADVISLYAEKLPHGGTATRFHSNVEPLRRMPPELRERLRGYTIRCVHDLATMAPDARPYLDEAATEGPLAQQHDWPLVRSHPHRPGTEVLYCSLQQTARVLELASHAESRALLASLFDEHLYREENTYEHPWSPGELVVWDNCALQHSRAALARDGGARVLRRVSVCRAGNGIEETVAFLSLSGTAEAFR